MAEASTSGLQPGAERDGAPDDRAPGGANGHSDSAENLQSSSHDAEQSGAGRTVRPDEIISIALPGGTIIHVRQIEPGDEEALRRFHSRLSPSSVYQRFFEWMPELSEKLATYFTHVDGVDRHALVALDPSDPREFIAVVRYDREPHTTSAEYAAVVGDDWQGQHLGMLLTRQLIDDARAFGVNHFYAIIRPENRAMISLLQRVGDDLGRPTHLRNMGDSVRLDLDIS